MLTALPGFRPMQIYMTETKMTLGEVLKGSGAGFIRTLAALACLARGRNMLREVIVVSGKRF